VDTANDDTMSIDSSSSLFMDDDETADVVVQEPEPTIEYFPRCGNCIDDEISRCNFRHRRQVNRNGHSHPARRRPGEVCTRCESIGKPCEDRPRPPRGEHDDPLPLASDQWKRDYRKRQKREGHVGQGAEGRRKHRTPGMYKAFKVLARLYPLLLDETSGRHVSLAKKSMLCVPKRKPDEGKILSLVESISEPFHYSQLMKEQRALLLASTSSNETTTTDSDAGQSVEVDSDDEMKDDDPERIVMKVLGNISTIEEVVTIHID